jgi:L-alanine-DL-glutamate epimerase-like enolase superfamily enzyme
MRLRFQRFDLQLRHHWAIATDLGRGGGKSTYPVVFVELTDAQGRTGLGEGSPSSQYHETHETVAAFLRRVDPARLSFDDLPGSVAYLESLAPTSPPAICAVNLALLDGAATAAGLPLCEFLGLGAFTEGRHLTSFTIGIDTPEMMGRKAAEAAEFPALKLKLGSPRDRENFAAVRAAAPGKRLRVDANAGWPNRDEALRHIEWLATDGAVDFVEQPMPPELPTADWAWLKARSPLPLYGDELYQGPQDADRCAECVHGVNVKLVKTGGVTRGLEALQAARARGLQTMLGCMIESSVLISAAAHLAALTDHLDLDGAVLITNDPYAGVRIEHGLMTFAGAQPSTGLRVHPRGDSPFA